MAPDAENKPGGKKKRRERKDDLTKAGKLEKWALSFTTKAKCKLENLEGKENMERERVRRKEGKKEGTKEGRKSCVRIKGRNERK